MIIAARSDKEQIQGILRLELSLLLELSKCKSLVRNPHLLPKGIYRRTPETPATSTKTRIAKEHSVEGRYMREQLDFDPNAANRQNAEEETAEVLGYPFPLRTLGEHY